MTQPQREALIGLLILAIHTDAHISLSEEEVLERTIDEQGWDSSFPKSLFLEKVAAAARVASESEEGTKAFIKERAAHFTTAPAQAAAYSVIHQVLSPDGVATEEHAFLSQLNKAFPDAFL